MGRNGKHSELDREQLQNKLPGHVLTGEKLGYFSPKSWQFPLPLLVFSIVLKILVIVIRLEVNQKFNGGKESTVLTDDRTFYIENLKWPKLPTTDR